ncbi:MAG: hypothetical protein JXD19_11030 [Deltaproteobacteria bacterium]|nr:hypothetical protein [Deltaproteobacteria bacterium]
MKLLISLFVFTLLTISFPTQAQQNDDVSHRETFYKRLIGIEKTLTEYREFYAKLNVNKCVYRNEIVGAVIDEIGVSLTDMRNLLLGNIDESLNIIKSLHDYPYSLKQSLLLYHSLTKIDEQDGVINTNYTFKDGYQPENLGMQSLTAFYFSDLIEAFFWKHVYPLATTVEMQPNEK